MQSGDLVSVVQFNGYRFEDVFLSQALRIQNFIELGAWFARYFGVPVSRQAIHYHAVSYGIQEVYVDTGNTPGWRRSTASSQSCGSAVTI